MMKITKITDYKLAESKEQITKSFRIVDLKKFLKELGLKISGKKCILVDRLYNYIINTKTNCDNQSKIVDTKLINIYKLFVDVRRANTYNIDTYNTNDLKLTLAKHRLKTNGPNNILIKRLYILAKKLFKYQKYDKQIILIQRHFRNFINNIYQKYNNYQINQCINTEDFLTFDDLTYIKKQFLFILKHTDNLIYGFDIRSLYKYILTKNINPYNNQKFSKKIINEIKLYYNILKLKNKIKIKDNKLSVSNSIRDKAIKIFQIMNVELNNYVDVNWFLNLNNFKLRKLYAKAEDIWNYRAQHLDLETRKKHIPNNDAFKMRVHDFFKLHNRFQMQSIILNEFEKFVTEGITIEERKTGAMWMLTALVEVSIDACNAMPWLLQS